MQFNRILIGSIDKVWPWKIVVLTRVDSSGETVPFIEKSVMPYYFEGNPKILLALSLSAVGFFIVYALNRLLLKIERYFNFLDIFF